MSSENVPAPAAPVSTNDWPVLSPPERRVLGVLVEKAKTTPDAYPLSLNALVTGCNQKSNREPLTNFTDAEVEDALAGLQKRQLVGKVIGGRVERWRHFLYESWHVNKVELAVLTELLLRGPQTEGELRARASRMEPIDDLEALRGVLRTLRDRGLIVYLTPEGRRGTTLTHGFHAADELDRLRAGAGAELSEEAPRLAAAPRDDDRVAVLERQLAELRTQVADLTAQVAALKQTPAP